MIKIIKEGTKKTTTCDECGCYFSYEFEDTELRKEITPIGVRTFERNIKCPQCESTIILEATR